MKGWQMACKIDPVLKFRLKAAGLTYRDFSELIGETPNVVGLRLNGYLPLAEEKRSAWNEILDQLENQKSETVRG